MIPSLDLHDSEVPGSLSAAAGMFTLRRRHHHGSIRSSASSHSCRNSRSNVACIDRLPSWKLPSTLTSRSVTPIQNRSDGQSLPTTSLHRSNASAAERSAITKPLHRNFRIGTLVGYQLCKLIPPARPPPFIRCARPKSLSRSGGATSTAHHNTHLSMWLKRRGFADWDVIPWGILDSVARVQ
jgi:hypothetical protein